MDGLPPFRTLLGRRDLKLSKLGLITKFALQLEHCYDKSIAPHIRFHKLGAILCRSSEIQTVEKELLLWMATARWLARAKASLLAYMALKEYQNLSLKLSNGGSGDVLMVAQDLRERDWYRAYESSHPQESGLRRMSA